MLLRESGKQAGQAYALAGATGQTGVVGVADEAALMSVAEAVYHADVTQLAHMRAELLPLLGAEKLVDAIGVAAAFNGITKVANATGIPLDENTEVSTVEMRAQTGIDDFAECAKAARFDTA